MYVYACQQVVSLHTNKQSIDILLSVRKQTFQQVSTKLKMFFLLMFTFNVDVQLLVKSAFNWFFIVRKQNGKEINILPQKPSEKKQPLPDLVVDKVQKK